MVCNSCHALFKESEAGERPEREHYEFWGAPFTHTTYVICCPVCRSEDIADGPYCECGEPIRSHQKYCEECLEERNYENGK